MNPSGKLVRKQPPTRTLGVRLDPEVRARLEAEAGRLRLEPGTLARRLLTGALSDESGSELRTLLSSLRGEVSALRSEMESLRLDTKALKRNLWNAALENLIRTEPMSPAEANRWAKENMTR